MHGLAELTYVIKTTPPEALPIGIFASRDSFAPRIYQHVRRTTSAEIGKDVLVVGCDNAPLADYLDPSLTSVHQPFRQVGALAMKKVIQLIYGESVEPELVQPELIARKSA